METVTLKRGMVLGMRHEPMDYAYFPVDAIISLVGGTIDGLGVEVGMVGQEGYVGLPILFGKPIHIYQSTVQHPGMLWRVPGTVLQDALHVSRSLREQLLRYTTVRFVQLAQTAVCHRFHPLEQRLCRWLLSVQDRLRSSEISLTHEWLGQLIGGRRPTISTITNDLRKSGVIELRRGSLVILDRTALEQLSCECYRIIAQEVRELSKPLPLSSS
jgi:CRP-like cAMP-binding protein